MYSPGIAHALDVVRTIQHDCNLRAEPFVVANADDVVVFSGWAFAPDMPGGQVYARIGDALVPATAILRGDVAALYGDVAMQAGFSVAVAVGAFDAGALDVDLVYAPPSGEPLCFDRRRIVVFRGETASRSALIELDSIASTDSRAQYGVEPVISLGGKAVVRGWAHVVDGFGNRSTVVALVAAGRVFQGTYGLPRPDVFEHLQVGPDVGFCAHVATVRIPPGVHEVRARLYASDGSAAESIGSLRFRLDGELARERRAPRAAAT